jgi:hypothetical protein
MSEVNTRKTNGRGSLRRSPRGKIKIWCRRGALDLGPNLALSVLDISETGVRLILREPLRLGQEVSITLEGAGGVKPAKRLGKVVWSVPSADGSHCTGVSFEKRLDYRQFLELT